MKPRPNILRLMDAARDENLKLAVPLAPLKDSLKSERRFRSAFQVAAR